MTLWIAVVSIQLLLSVLEALNLRGLRDDAILRRYSGGVKRICV